MAGKIEEGRLQYGGMVLRPCDGHGSFHVIDQEFFWHSTKLQEGHLQALQEHGTPLGYDKPRPGDPGIPEDEGVERELPPPALVENDPARRPVHLGLAPRLGLEAVHDPLDVGFLDGPDELLEDGDSSRVTPLPKIPEEGGRRQFEDLHAAADIGVERDPASPAGEARWGL